MTGLPNLGDRVRVYPAPGRKVQKGMRPVDHLGAGSWLPKEGADVIWSEFHHEQMKMGDLLLHEPPDSQSDYLPPVEVNPSKKSKAKE